MVKAALKNLLVSIFLVFLISCTISSSYSRKDVDKAIKKICKEEFGLDVGVWVKNDTIWVYAPFKKLVDSQGQYDEKADKDLQHIYLSLRRAFLNMDEPPRFYCFIASDTEEFGLDTYNLVFVPDLIKYSLGLISRDEFSEKNVYLNFANIEALGDKEGKHITKYDISIVEFLALLVEQNIEREFLYSETKDNYQINDIHVDPYSLAMDVSFDIEVKDYVVGFPSPLERAEELIREILSYYASFHQIQQITLKDEFKQQSKEITLLINRKQDLSLKQYDDTIPRSLAKIYEPNSFIHKAARKYEKGEFEAAIEEYGNALKAIPDSVNALYGLGNAYYALGQYETAAGYVEKARKLKPGYHEIEISLAILYINLGRTSKALSILDKAIAANPDKPVVHNSAGYAYLVLGNYDRALKEYQKVFTLNKDFPEIYKYLGYTHSGLQNYGQAITFLEKALEQNPSDFDIYYELGSVYTTLMKYSEAVTNFQKCLSISDDYAPAYASLGLIYGYLGQIEKAQTNLQKAKELFEAEGNQEAIAEIDQYLQELDQ